MVELSAAEAAVYDRQLRVWGIEVQKRCGVSACSVVGLDQQICYVSSFTRCVYRLNAAKVLIAGCTGLGAEVTVDF